MKKENAYQTIQYALKNGFKGKHKLLGCTHQQAIDHLIISWFLNYGTVYNNEPSDLDHRTPISKITAENTNVILHISNFQLLSKSNNRQKSNQDWRPFGGCLSRDVVDLDGVIFETTTFSDDFLIKYATRYAKKLNLYERKCLFYLLIKSLKH